MLNIGIDFGSTYTTVSVYREDTKILESIIMSQSSPFIPSVFSDNNGLYEYGRAAKKLTGKKGVKVYKGFKMLIPERDQDILQERGYDAENTPEKVTELFLDCVLRQILKCCHETKIDNLVAGVPEIWNDGVTTLDGRILVRDILKRLGYIDHVKIVSEPAAASAFFAYNFQLLTKKCFKGQILIIDYGGGTLDITLSDVKSKLNENGEETVEIKVLERTGAGENEEGKIGKAGIVYMESVVKEALKKEGLIGENDAIEHDIKFQKTVDMLEEELQDRFEFIEETFEEYGIDYPEDLENKDFTSLEYKGEDFTITFRTLLEVYNKVIQPVFEEKLDEIIVYNKKHGINCMERNQDHFKIALVGGFGNYYLVKKQVQDKFGFSEFDKRQKNIIVNKSDCEKAISLGAALLAANVIEIKNTAAYSIGLGVKDSNGKTSKNYAIRYHQEIEFNKTYFPKDENGKEFVVYSGSGGFFQFIINMRSDDRTAMIVPIKEKFRNRLSNIINNEFMTAAIGFSLDSSGVLSLHVHDYDFLEDKIDTKGHTIELTSFNELFEVTRVERVI